MSLLIRNLVDISCRYYKLNGLANTIRSLHITPYFLRQNNRSQLATVTALPRTITDANIRTDFDKITKETQDKIDDVFNKISEECVSGKAGRLFAIVHLCGKQFKVTSGDLILVEGYWKPTIGDEIRLEKVLLAGSKDFTLFGRPILDPGVVDIKATIIEKTLTHTKTHFKKKRRKQYLRINFQRSPNTMIRINSIEINQNKEAKSFVDSDKRIF